MNNTTTAPERPSTPTSFNSNPPPRERLRTLPPETENLDLSLDKKTHDKTDKLIDTDLLKVVQFPNVKVLNLSGNDIKEFPAEVANLSKLGVLDISKNELKSLPKNVELLSNLTDLNARLNGIKPWPQEINKLKLVKLDLAFNDINEIKMGASRGFIPFVSAPPPPIVSSLRSLDISFNDFTSFPSKVLELPNLETLNLSKNKISDLPSSMSKMAESLTCLRAEQIGVTSFPEVICQLYNLKELNLSDNKIQTLPAAEQRLNNLVNLRELYLNSCELKGWSQLYCQAKLKVLHLTNNQIMGIPTEISTLYLLEELKLNKNKISHIPAHIRHLGNLKVLDLSDNRVEDIDENIGKLGQLQVLKLSNNMITEFPEMARELSGLIELNISQNQIKYLPDMSKMVNLTTLEASNNMILQIPKGIGKCVSLKVINLTFNSITTLPDEFYDLQTLAFCRLKHNAIETLSERIANMKSLEELNVDNNELEKLPEEITQCQKLKTVYMNYNWTFVVPPSIQSWINQNGVKFECQFETASKVMDGLFIGSANAATSKRLLRQLGITHIVTVAHNIPPKYADTFNYMVIYVDDVTNATLKPHFYQAANFIESGRKVGAGVMIHCMAGVSRSATIMTAYLMISEKQSLQKAFSLLASKRSEVRPNRTFRAELVQFDKEINEGVPPATTTSNLKANRVEYYVPTGNGKYTMTVQEAAKKAQKEPGGTSELPTPTRPGARGSYRPSGGGGGIMGFIADTLGFSSSAEQFDSLSPPQSVSDIQEEALAPPSQLIRQRTATFGPNGNSNGSASGSGSTATTIAPTTSETTDP